MFERFTDRARKVMALANQQAQRLNHAYIGSEHILLALVEEGTGVGATVLKNIGIDLEMVRVETEMFLKPGEKLITTGMPPQMPPLKRVIVHAVEESHNMGHRYVGTEHLLLGLLRDEEGIAAQVLFKLGVTTETARGQLLALLNAPASTKEKMPSAASPQRLGQPLETSDSHLEAKAVARELGHVAVNTGHVLLALLRRPTSIAMQAFKAAGVDTKRLQEEALKLLQTDADKP